MRQHALCMTHHANASHIGSCLSSVDILAVLYDTILNVRPDNPLWPDRDRFILSKGHAAAAVYAVLAEKGFFPKDWLETYCDDGGKLAGHISHKGVPGVEVSTGSLGHGLPIACGMALAAKRDKKLYRTYVLLSDGECDEGSVWEAILFAPEHKLDNLVVIVDYNRIQSFGRVEDVLELEPFADKWRAFRWFVTEVNGHDHGELEKAFRAVPVEKGRPSVIIANTKKGKGVSFMEDQLAWHYKSPNPEQLAKALLEVRDSD